MIQVLSPHMMAAHERWKTFKTTSLNLVSKISTRQEKNLHRVLDTYPLHSWNSFWFCTSIHWHNFSFSKVMWPLTYSMLTSGVGYYVISVFQALWVVSLLFDRNWFNRCKHESWYNFTHFWDAVWCGLRTWWSCGQS